MEGSQPQDEPQGATNLNSFEPAGKNQLQQTPIQCKSQMVQSNSEFVPPLSKLIQWEGVLQEQTGLILADWVAWVGYSDSCTRVCKCTRAKVQVKAKAVASSVVSNRPARDFTGKMENKTGGGPPQLPCGLS